MKRLLKEVMLGDMIARYVMNEEGNVGLILLPSSMPYPHNLNKNVEVDSLIQLKLTGDIYNEAYAQGISLRNSESVRRLRYKEQNIDDGETSIQIKTMLQDARGYLAIHYLNWEKNERFVRIHCDFINESENKVTLELFESFSISEITPYIEADAQESMEVFRIRSVWSQEGRLERTALEDLQLEPAWDPHAVRCERFGQMGSMPVNKFFPFVGIADKKNHVYWGAQISHPASWQMEIYRKDNGLSISGGLADREFGHWLKHIERGERFATPEAIVTVAKIEMTETYGEESEIDILCKRLTDAAKRGMLRAPESEKELPIIFNEYCTTWGCPSHENISDIVNVIKDKGFRYFVIDCGWYKQEGIPWDQGMGDYEVSSLLFPEGLSKTVELIKEAGMIPGIWFEIENVGSAAKAYQREDHLLQKDGKTLTTYFRRFWDMCDPWVEEYLTQKVIAMSKNYGFGYMKIDYNESIGIGCDGKESLGEGLRQTMEASQEFINKIKREIPDMVLENCASGGHRLEPGWMEMMSMASFSDAHECVGIPIIAADLHRVIHPAQSQIWAVIRRQDSLKRIAYSVASTFLGRMCISGDVVELEAKQWDLIEKGMRFYEKIVPVIKNGQTFHWGNKIKSLNHPKGWQGVVRSDGHMVLVVIHTFEGDLPEWIEINLPCTNMKIVECYSRDGREEVRVNGSKFYYKPKENFEAVAYIGEI